MDKFVIYGLNILIIALPLALFEILIEKDKGWGSGWNKERWYAKSFALENPVVQLMVRVFKTESPLNYHFLTFVVVIPSFFVFEYFYWTNNILLLCASFVGVIAFEDFFWYLLNWNFDALSQLLKGPSGTIWWHKRWTRISKKYYLPASYFLGFLLSFVLLLLA